MPNCSEIPNNWASIPCMEIKVMRRTLNYLSGYGLLVCLRYECERCFVRALGDCCVTPR